MCLFSNIGIKRLRRVPTTSWKDRSPVEFKADFADLGNFVIDRSAKTLIAKMMPDVVLDGP